MSNFDHPSEEALERFLLHAVEGVELVRLEGHILACEPCILRLEEIELDLAATKLALKRFLWRENCDLLTEPTLPARHLGESFTVDSPISPSNPATNS